ncbi:MAG: ComEC/Rec2 family competence protein [Ginsengibacter sp.]
MTKTYKIHIWKKVPFLRLLLPVIIGIILQYYFTFSLKGIITTAGFLVISLVLFTFLPLVYRFKLMGIQGILITLLIICTGIFFTWQKNIRNHNNWYGKYYDSSSLIVAIVKEPPVEKAKSYKALVSVESVIKNDSMLPATGNILLYFGKDSGKATPAYGDKIIISKALQPIKNSGNPGAFDYARYSAFHQLFHQAYVKNNDWVFAGNKQSKGYDAFIFGLRNKIRKIIYKYIPGNEEKAIALALLIGYKIDLDKDLVQAYSNAGVVHLIAISGLHMGIIYSILFWLFAKIPVVKKSKMARLVLILFCLWFFALLTGASGSVLRSAFMFSFISIGLNINKKTSVYNSMAASAFLLLCYNPFLLWDVGFQLSYLAVLGIVIAQPFISKWFYFKNKLLRATWQLSSVSLAAQLFTFPVCIYYFHQLPLLFLFSNLIAIPLTTIALWMCILLIILSPVPLLATLTGKIIFCAIWLINHVVFFINAVPFSLWDNISLNVPETITLYGAVCCFLFWLIKKQKVAFKVALACYLIFACMIVFNKWQAFNQKKIIVYNIPSHKAIDFVSGNNYKFSGDSALAIDGVLKNFHLKPGRISLLIKHASGITDQLYQNNNFYKFYNKRILVIDSAVSYILPARKMTVDYIIISGNPKLFIPNLAAVFNAGIFIFDASNPMWKIDKWKKDCEELHLRFHSVPEQGAFVTDI